MKRVLCILLALLMLTMAACGNPDQSAESTPTTGPTEPTVLPSDPPAADCSHYYRIVNTVASTCIEAGYTEYRCESCQHSYRVEMALTEHSFTDATCMTPKYCTTCFTPEGEALGHDFQGYICSRCGASAEECVVPEGGYDGSPVTIVFYHSMGSYMQSILDDAIAEFNKIYPNITIIHDSLGDYDGLRNQISTEITIGSAPNLAYCYADHVALYNMADAVQPLDDLIASQYGLTDAQIADFIPAFYDEGKAFGDGKMYTLPISKSTEVLYYNKTFFDQYGLTVPTTWEEMADVCEKIKQIDPTCVPLGYDSEANWFITMAAQYGSEYTSSTGEKFLFDNETNRDFVKMLRLWYENGWITTQGLCGGYTSFLFTGYCNPRCYMCIGSTGGASYQQPRQTNGVYEFEVGIASIPQVNPDQPKVISQGPSICVFKNSDPQEVIASWLFAKYLATDVVFQMQVSMYNGYTPVIQSVMDHPVYASFLNSASTANIQAYAVKVALEQANAYFVSPAFYGSSVARDQVGLLIQKCLTQPATDVDAMIKKVFADAVAECRYQCG